jgi:hypothetical protein
LFNLFDAPLARDGRIEGWTPRHDAAGEIAKLGHSRSSITMDVYSHVAPQMRQDAADAMDRAFLT